jgi:apyrase
LRALAACFSLSLAVAPVQAAYVGVIDAGSSASRLYVYKVTPSEMGVEDVLEVGATTAPLAAFADEPAKVGDAVIGPLLGALDRELGARGIPKSEIALHVLATGGMRLAPAPAARAIEAAVRRAVTEGGYRPGRTDTISGEMEGFYAWLDVNMLLGRLAPGRTPVGIVEIGGASMQVAYAGAPPSAPGVVTASYGGQTYSVRSVSLLGLGTEQARKSLLAGAGASTCFPAGLVTDRPDLQNLQGAFDSARCTAEFAGIVKGPAQALPRDEIKDVSFIGLGRPLTGVLGEWRLAQNQPAALKNSASQNCPLPWAGFTAAVGATPYTPYLCMNSIYLATLLFDPAGFGLRAEQVVAAERLAGRRPSWTRGAALMLRD